ncbi:MAG: toxin-antitoxin system YwqK family antitoxin [Bacteroidales bacterium]|nr:toxin-antitoxin system YwqK family antitoxin [Bacteroidales bacterium]
MKTIVLKIFLPLVMAVFVAVSGNAQVIGERQADGSVINYIDINKKKQGKWVKKYSNGNVRYEGFFTNDIPSGTFKYYFESGKKKSILVYNDDHSSSVEMFWESGATSATGGYDPENKRHGEWHFFNESGKLIEVINYVHGKAEGNVKIYYPNTTQLALDCMYEGGKRNGYYKYYFANGNMHEDGFYKDGSRHGHWKIYTPDGTLEEEGDYAYGNKEGEWMDYRTVKTGETVVYKHGYSDKEKEQMEELRRKAEWAKEHQDQFMHPEDYLDDPMEFFRHNPNVDYGETPAGTREAPANPNNTRSGSQKKGSRK